MTEPPKRFTVEEYTGDASIVDKYKVGQEGVVRLEVLVNDDVYKVILVRDKLKAMQ